MATIRIETPNYTMVSVMCVVLDDTGQWLGRRDDAYSYPGCPPKFSVSPTTGGMLICRAAEFRAVTPTLDGEHEVLDPLLGRIGVACGPYSALSVSATRPDLPAVVGLPYDLGTLQMLADGDTGDDGTAAIIALLRAYPKRPLVFCVSTEEQEQEADLLRHWCSLAERAGSESRIETVPNRPAPSTGRIT